MAVMNVDERHERLFPVLREIYGSGFEIVEQIDYRQDGLHPKKVFLLLRWPKEISRTDELVK